MKPSTQLIAALKQFEGCRLKAYKCPAGVWTIGIGHTKGVKFDMEISNLRAEELLSLDLEPIVKYVNTISAITTQGQFDAVVDFIFNCGRGAFDGSTLKKYILAHQRTDYIQAQFMRWTKAGGKTLPGLVARRKWEAQRWAQ